MKSIQIGALRVDYLTMDGALDRIEALVSAERGGYVVTPNVDHVVMGERDEGLRAAYNQASLSLADGMPLLWLSRLLGCALPAKVSGSDLIRPLMLRAAESGMTVYILGAAPGVGARAAEILRQELPALKVVGIDSPPMGFEKDEATEGAALAKLRAADPDIALMALGAPKQEILMHRWYGKGVRAVMLGIGASIDFVAGEAKRAPRWVSEAGLEWLYRLTRDPKRLARRYLLRDPEFLLIALRTLSKPRGELLSGMDDSLS